MNHTRYIVLVIIYGKFVLRRFFFFLSFFLSFFQFLPSFSYHLTLDSKPYPRLTALIHSQCMFFFFSIRDRETFTHTHMLCIDIRMLIITKIYPAALPTLTTGGPHLSIKLICTQFHENTNTKKNSAVNLTLIIPVLLHYAVWGMGA